jgi:transglutaminase-like putative cysteine protease
MRFSKPGIIIGAFITSAVIFWITVEALEKRGKPAIPEPTYSMSRQVRYSFTVQNTTNRLLKQADFWTYGPVKQTSTQLCVNLEATDPYQLISDSDEFGNQILHFSLQNLPPYSTRIITIKADLRLTDTPNPSSVKDLERYLQPERGLESDDPEISVQAEELKQADDLKTAESIFHWVGDYLQYTGYSAKDRGALFALKQKKGDCTEFMSLFVALCRAVGVPARAIGGYVCTENTILKPSAYHNWAEFYQDGAWKLADPQKKVFMEKPSHYIATRVIGESSKNPLGEYHMFRFEGEGLKIRMNG